MAPKMRAMLMNRPCKQLEASSWTNRRFKEGSCAFVSCFALQLLR
jgi:hypothetical protein